MSVGTSFVSVSSACPFFADLAANREGVASIGPQPCNRTVDVANRLMVSLAWMFKMHVDAPKCIVWVEKSLTSSVTHLDDPQNIEGCFYYPKHRKSQTNEVAIAMRMSYRSIQQLGLRGLYNLNDIHHMYVKRWIPLVQPGLKACQIPDGVSYVLPCLLNTHA